MEREKALRMVLGSYNRYYNVKTEGVCAPFCAEAVFQTHNEKYFLTRIAKIAEEDSNEFVFIACEAEVTPEVFQMLEEKAWSEGLGRVVPASGHRNSDITLIVIADRTGIETEKLVRRCRHYRSYRFSFWGWSHFKCALLDLEHDRIITNRMGGELAGLFPAFKG
ncbi:MAG: hypothetical protein IJ831_02740 [Spirochaetales bacterium]|nr:hypothetical protein [Spirochaetales bacterium]